MQCAIDRTTGTQDETHPPSTQKGVERPTPEQEGRDQPCLLEWCESGDGGVQGLSWVVDPWIQACPCRCHIQNVINELCGPSAGQDAKGSKCRCCPEGDGPPDSPMGTSAFCIGTHTYTHYTHTHEHTNTQSPTQSHTHTQQQCA